MHPQSNAAAAKSLDQRFSLIYEELHRMASALRRREAHATIHSAALVNEAWIKLKDSPRLAKTSTLHFKAIAANAMRQILVEEARRRNAQKRGGAGNAILIPLGETAAEFPSVSAELLDLDVALNELALMNARHAQIVEHIFFGGLTVPETAEVMRVSASLVERDWKAAKAWLAMRLRPQAK
jgi:RNA polymerase sigma factor (TIGR02999 family)